MCGRDQKAEYDRNTINSGEQIKIAKDDRNMFAKRVFTLVSHDERIYIRFS